MSTPILRKSNSPSSWGVKQCLKVAAGLVALSQLSIAQACRPSTIISISYEEGFNEICKGKACSTQFWTEGGIVLIIRNHYDKGFHYKINGGNQWADIGKKCSPDGVFCLTFFHPNDATLYYANTEFMLGAPSVLQGSQSMGRAEYWNCL
ncbi:hypothetical protein CPC16_002075 [Podila verticillata]|nr:hypothetical protein CPC16_002075 [Podila verticillata]KAI9240041.1 MAG: hypothetical protein BYD32DRAFT_477074 [Podila humilis]